MAAITCYRPNSNASSLGCQTLDARTAKIWTQHQIAWPERLNAIGMLERHDATATLVTDPLKACQDMMECESVQKEPTSVLDLQTSPGSSHLSVSVSSQHSVNSGSDGTSRTIQTVTEILDDEHDSSFLQDPSHSSTLEQVDMMTWMQDFMPGDTSAGLVMPPDIHAGHFSCQMKPDRPIADATQYTDTNHMEFGYGMDLMECVGNVAFHYRNHHLPESNGNQLDVMAEPTKSVLAKLENQLFSDAFPVNQNRLDHQRISNGISEGLPPMLGSVSAAVPAATQLQKYTVVPTAELLRLLSSQNHSSPGGNYAKSQEIAGGQNMQRSWGMSSLAASAERPIQVQATSTRWAASIPPAPPQEENGLHLVHLLLACAEAIESSEYTIASPMLTRLQMNALPDGDPMQRIALYFADALSERLAKEMAAPRSHESIHTCNSRSKVPGTCEASVLDVDLAHQAYYQILPFQKFSHFTANQALLEAVGDSPSVHIVDLNIRQGLQWPGFIQSLAVLPNGPPRLRITAVEPNAFTAQLTGNRLTEFAKSLQVPFEFNIVAEKVEDLHQGMIRRRPHEALAINCSDVLHSLLRNQGGLQSLLRTIRRLSPVVVTLLEVDANHNFPSFMARFVEALHYYCALFDSLEANLDRRSSERLRIEHLCFGSDIRSIIASEGAARRVRHVRAETWQTYFRQAGFRGLPLSRYAADQAQLLLGLYEASSNMPFRLSHEFGGLSLGWQETPVVVVSSWAC